MMQGLGGGLVDPSVFVHRGSYYLLGNLRSEQNVLRLWCASNAEFSDYKEHKDSPVALGIHGGRNGGRIFRKDNKLYRLGQDMSKGYGDGVYLFEITQIDEHVYEERELDALRFKGDIHGPHTVDYDGVDICWDYYTNEFSMLAGYRRMASKLIGYMHSVVS